jgi:hypothetical protein
MKLKYANMHFMRKEKIGTSAALFIGDEGKCSKRGDRPEAGCFVPTDKAACTCR